MSWGEPTCTLITTYGGGDNVCEMLLAGANGRVVLKPAPDKTMFDHTLTSAKYVITLPSYGDYLVLSRHFL